LLRRSQEREVASAASYHAFSDERASLSVILPHRGRIRHESGCPVLKDKNWLPGLL
jgi:hypothetical protein